MATDIRPCMKDGCTGTVTFETGLKGGLRGQSLVSHATCPTCGTNQILTEEGRQGISGE